MIYFMRIATSGSIMIETPLRIALFLDNRGGPQLRGMTKGGRVRRHNPNTILAMMDGGPAEVRGIHERFAHLRVPFATRHVRRETVPWFSPSDIPEEDREHLAHFRVSHELFEPTPELGAFLAEHGRPWDGEDARLLGKRWPKPRTGQFPVVAVPTSSGLRSRLPSRRG